ncbi:MAG: sugar transferase [Pseudomonadota bacterium]
MALISGAASRKAKADPAHALAQRQRAVAASVEPARALDADGPFTRGPRVVLGDTSAHDPDAIHGGVSGYLRSRTKRSLDIVLATAALAFLLPLLGFVWLAVRLTSQGPGVFWSDRIGRHGVEFSMPKFRTMKAGTPTVQRERLAASDATYTPIGPFLRWSSIDELPQLFCVLAGTMSLVGPRPLIASDEGTKARRRLGIVFDARPGVTGFAQVSGRNALAPDDKAALDGEYCRTCTLAMDLRILRQTVGVILRKQGFMR